MYHTLLRYIEKHSTTPLASGDIELIQSKFTPKKIRKGQYLLQEGETCHSVAFIVKGAVRQYSIDDKGAERIIQLAIENWWFHDRESLLALTASGYNIDAREDTDVLVLPFLNNFQMLFDVVNKTNAKYLCYFFQIPSTLFNI